MSDEPPYPFDYVYRSDRSYKATLAFDNFIIYHAFKCHEGH